MLVDFCDGGSRPWWRGAGRCVGRRRRGGRTGHGWGGRLPARQSHAGTCAHRLRAAPPTLQPRRPHPCTYSLDIPKRTYTLGLCNNTSPKTVWHHQENTSKPLQLRFYLFLVNSSIFSDIAYIISIIFRREMLSHYQLG